MIRVVVKGMVEGDYEGSTKNVYAAVKSDIKFVLREVCPDELSFMAAHIFRLVLERGQYVCDYFTIKGVSR
jgi:hypothetical protein